MRAAIYTRFSSDRQRDASTEDQVRKCEDRAAAEKWRVVARFKDEAISGATADRPGYQAMRRAAAAREFDVLLVEDLSRLSRDQPETEKTIRRLEFDGIRVIGLSDGYDSTSGKSRKLLRTIRSAINETYLDDLRDKTHRGLEGQAIKGNNTGGRTYGYTHVPIEDPTRTDTLGRPLVTAVRREIDPVQADVVRRIFAWYAEGKSARWIADSLNREAIPSPGSTWNRARPLRGWSASSIAGPVAGTGILNNELYVGRYAWNRSKWVKDPDTGKRCRIERPAAEWIVTEQPELRIVEPALWDRVKRRQRERAQTIGARVRAGISAPGYRGTGAPAKYLLSGLLRCGECGANFVIANRTHYACASQVNGRQHFCSNTLRVSRALVEAKLLDGIQHELLAPDVIARVCAELPKLIAAAARAPRVDQKQVAELRAKIANLSDAIEGGALKSSPALAERLQRAESELARLEADAAVPVAKVARMVPKVAESWRAVVADMGNAALHDVGRARAELRRLLGSEIRLSPAEDRTFLEASGPDVSARLVQLAVANGLNFKEKNNVVAGGCNRTRLQVQADQRRRTQ